MRRSAFWSFSSLLIASHVLPGEAPLAQRSPVLCSGPLARCCHMTRLSFSSPCGKTYDFNIQWSNAFCKPYSVMQMKGSDHTWISILSGFRWPHRKLSPTLLNCLTLGICAVHCTLDYDPPCVIWCWYWLSCFQLFAQADCKLWKAEISPDISQCPRQYLPIVIITKTLLMTFSRHRRFLGGLRSLFTSFQSQRGNTVCWRIDWGWLREKPWQDGYGGNQERKVLILYRPLIDTEKWPQGT